jgi:hypothetical protein
MCTEYSGDDRVSPPSPVWAASTMRIVEAALSIGYLLLFAANI